MGAVAARDRGGGRPLANPVLPPPRWSGVASVAGSDAGCGCGRGRAGRIAGRQGS
ncbi:hypothetical protein SAMN04487904_104199 [Actinopolyspora lacussalsi subsp. righensis]|uniref:Uncharacterized protein n=1 Tax=Actinopolyspora righensis TaxID=995060 RepID=A0A1I6ZCP0_9ACTN|nr:hypothetical protein SAMN04487904_104199 [Actinopolyspora righensis]